MLWNKLRGNMSVKFIHGPVTPGICNVQSSATQDGLEFGESLLIQFSALCVGSPRVFIVE